MGRRIYIIPKTMKVEDAMEDAKAANCPEIVHGVPPALVKELWFQTLPLVYEEPDRPEPDAKREVN